MKKTLILLILVAVFLIGLTFVNAEKVDVAENIKEYILDNYKNVELTRQSILFYYNPNVCLDCEESKKEIDNLKSEGYKFFITDKYFTQLSAGSLAICLNDYSTRPNIKPGEIKDYADYCKTFKMPSGGINAVVPEKKIQATETKTVSGMKTMGVQTETASEDIVYVLELKGNYPSFGVYFDYNNPRIAAMSPEEQVALMNKVEAFVINRVWNTFHKHGFDLNKEYNKLAEERDAGVSEERRIEINKELKQIDTRQNELYALEQKVVDEGNLDLLKDYSLPYEGEVVDGFVLKKGTPPQQEIPKDIEDFFETEIGGNPDEQVIFVQVRGAYIYTEDKKPETQSEEVPTEEKPVIEEQPVTGIRRITEPIKKLFTGEPEKIEETPQEQPPEQPEEKKEGVVTRFFKKIFSWF